MGQWQKLACAFNQTTIGKFDQINPVQSSAPLVSLFNLKLPTW